MDTAELWKLEERAHLLWGELGTIQRGLARDQHADLGRDVSRDSVGTFIVNLRVLARAATRLADSLAKKYGIQG